MKTYKAPWCRGLVVISVLATVLCLLVSLLPWVVPTLGKGGGMAGALMWVPVLMIPGCAWFMVLGYSISSDEILVRRPFRVTRLPRAGLLEAEARPDAMRGSIRTFGNGGFYSVTGWYWSRGLKSYRAYVTDFKRTVVLRYRSRTLVVSPDDPEGFVRELTGDPWMAIAGAGEGAACARKPWTGPAMFRSRVVPHLSPAGRYFDLGTSVLTLMIFTLSVCVHRFRWNAIR